MKKFLFILLASVIFLNSCSLIYTKYDFVDSTTKEMSEKQDISSNQNIFMTVKDVTPDGLTLICDNLSDISLSCGSAFWVDVQTEYGWQEAQHITDQEIFWTQIAYEIDKTYEWTIGWENIYGTLSPGTYRIGKTFTQEENNIHYYAEFTI
ncbi:MAG: hypothetical protein IJO74_04270 [Clostridia bacterium]|nr:hypothetical protein [Clostridia bacterium]